MSYKYFNVRYKRLWMKPWYFIAYVLYDVGVIPGRLFVFIREYALGKPE